MAIVYKIICDCCAAEYPEDIDAEMHHGIFFGKGGRPFYLYICTRNSQIERMPPKTYSTWESASPKSTFFIPENRL